MSDSELYGDERFVEYLNKNKYHPRSNAHGNAICRLVLSDLYDHCKIMQEHLRKQRLVYKLNHTIQPKSIRRWNVDLVIGPPQDVFEESASDSRFIEGEPKRIFIAMDTKSIMTEHGKARRNRQRDFFSFQETVNSFDRQTIVGGLMVINIANRFKSPLRTEITEHRNIRKLVRESVELMRGIPYCENPKGNGGLDAMGVIVVDHSNIDREPTHLINENPAPNAEDRLHYRSFLRDLCSAYDARFGWA